MADGLNSVHLLGNLGADPELKMSSGGMAILKLRLATSESYLDKNKTRQERTEWHSVTVFGKRAEGLAKILSKGSKLFVDGRIQTSSYDDKDGNKRYRTDVVANNIILAGGKGERSTSASDDRGGAGQGGGGGYGSDDYGSGGDMDDVPFLLNVCAEAGERWWPRG